ncbi:MAG TPA: protoporphyrinogen oxidase, partial [Ilumatobacteraceae bacterium]
TSRRGCCGVKTDRHVAVVGGGIAGVSAAHAAIEAGARVTLFEAADRTGGVIRTTPFAGHPAIDEGADAFLARVPWAVDLARKVSLGDSLTSPSVGKAAVWWNGLHDIPDGLLLGMPTDIFGLARSSLLSRRGKLRAATEPLRPRTDASPDSIGKYVRSRFGNEVHERLVDPLVGSIYAADTDDFSLAAVPQLAELAERSRSVLLASRHRQPAAKGPIFYTPRAGVGALVDAVTAAIVARGAALRLGASVSEVALDGEQWRVDGEAFDAVVLACPSRVAASLLRTVEPSVEPCLTAIPAADVALITMAIPTAAGWPSRLRGLSGYLVPKPQQRLVTAVSFGSQKWSHWAGDDQEIVRVSMGRDGLSALHLNDEDLVADVLDELRHHLALDAQPTAVRVSRWPKAFPQYRPHHAVTLAAAERALPNGIALAGASYHGIGIPACVRSGQQAAATVLRE